MEAQQSGRDNSSSGDHVLELLSPFVDGETSVDETRLVEKHISYCTLCAGQLAFLRATARTLRQASPVFPSPDMFERIARATYRKPTFGERVAGFLRPAPVRVALGGALAAGLVAVLMVPSFRAGVAPHSTGGDSTNGTMASLPPQAAKKPVARPSVPAPSVSKSSDTTIAAASFSPQTALAGVFLAQHMGTHPVKDAVPSVPPVRPAANPTKTMLAGLTPLPSRLNDKPSSTAPQTPPAIQLHPVRKPIQLAMLPNSRGSLPFRGGVLPSRLPRPEFKVDTNGIASAAAAPVPVRPDIKPEATLAELTAKPSEGAGETALPQVPAKVSYRLGALTARRDKDKQSIIPVSYDRDAQSAGSGALPIVKAPVN